MSDAGLREIQILTKTIMQAVFFGLDKYGDPAPPSFQYTEAGRPLTDIKKAAVLAHADENIYGLCMAPRKVTIVSGVWKYTLEDEDPAKNNLRPTLYFGSAFPLREIKEQRLDPAPIIETWKKAGALFVVRARGGLSFPLELGDRVISPKPSPKMEKSIFRLLRGDKNRPKLQFCGTLDCAL
jgi:hypothetical protein